MTIRQRAPRNRTVTLDHNDADSLKSRLLRLENPCEANDVLGRTICQDLFQTLPHLPDSFVDLLIADFSITVVEDDFAALTGCAAYLFNGQG